MMSKELFMLSTPMGWVASTKKLNKSDFDDPFSEGIDPERRPNFIIKLARNIFKNGGNYVSFNSNDLEWWKFLYKLGRPFNDAKITYKTMALHECHRNSLRLWHKTPTKYKVVTGFVLRDKGVWWEHSWTFIPSENRVLDPLNISKRYYGFILTDEMAANWYKVQFPDKV